LLWDKAWATDLEAWATDLDLPAFAVTAEQAAEQAAEVSSTAASSRSWRGTDPLCRGQAWQLQATQAHSRFPGARRRGLGNFRRRRQTPDFQGLADGDLATSGDAGTLQFQGLPTGCTNHISLLSKKHKNKCIWCKYAKMQNKNPKRKVILIFFSILYGIFTNKYKKLVQFFAFSSLLGLDLIFYISSKFK